ncbi:MAG: DUF429 domain-containing protein [Deltaproteobacteria bacterium]|nr:DUF429 domain-containing protein [Deltaproteobacteria bacterium]
MLISAAPALRGAIVLVDSPRWPRDLNWSKSASDQCIRLDAYRATVVASNTFRCGRRLDAALRALVFALRELGRNSAVASLSMFPTPPMNYFGAHLNSAGCKPHLRLLGRALFGRALNRDYGPASGGIFTRFMIAGFATYRALAPIAARVYECYPDLEFKLWRRGLQLFSKNSTMSRTAVLASRIRVLSALARELRISELPLIKRMDEADAAILAVSTAAAHHQRGVLTLENPDEGGFLLALKGTEAQYLKQRMSYI